MKDYAGGYALFTEHGTSASHMTAAKVLDTRLPFAITGEANDAVSAFTQVTMCHSARFLKSEDGMPDCVDLTSSKSSSNKLG